MKPLIAGITVTSLFAGSVEVERPEVLFTVGTVYVYKGEAQIKGSKNVRYTEYVKIESVQMSGIQMYSSGTMRFEFGDNENFDDPGISHFACDTTNYYIHTTNFAFVTVEQLKKGAIKVVGDSLIYPLKPKVGDTLPSASCKAVETYPSFTKTTNENYRNRIVEGVDTLNLECGKIVAYRIGMTKITQTKSNSNYTGKVEKKEEETITEWFAPKLGIVKVVIKRDNGGDLIELQSYTK